MLDFIEEGTLIAQISPQLFEKPGSQEFPQLRGGAQQTLTMPVALRGRLEEEGRAWSLQNCSEPRAPWKGEK